MAKVEVVMPQMGESVMEGTVIEWSKKVGDTVEVDETLLEIATDKVDTEVPSPEAGVLVEILVGEGDTIEVGAPIAIIETDTSAAESAPKKEEAPAAEPEVAAEPEREPEPEPAKEEAPAAKESAPASASSGGDRIEVVMPQMGESVMEGTIIEWAKKVGDTVEVDETLLEIATDKVDTEVPSPEAGTLVEILAEAGDTIEVGQPIAIISIGGSDAAEPAKQSAPAPAPAKKEEAPAESNGAPAAPASGEEGSSPQRMGSDGRFYSPLVRSIAKEEGISQEELESIEGSGQGNRVSKNDILAFVEQKKSGKAPAPAKAAAAPAPSLSKPVSAPATENRESIKAGELNIQRPKQNVEIIKMDRMRKMIADHMVRSKQTSAHVTTFADVDVTNVVAWREANKGKFEKQTGVKLTYTPIFIEAFIQAMREFPLINSSVEGDEIHVKRDINFGIAVALGVGGEGGLIVPVIKAAQDMNLVGLAKSVNELAEKARSKNLKPDDLVGGTITLTNYGSVGNLMGTPIINQPQVAILGTGVIEKRPVVLETEMGDVIAIRRMMYLSMSYDHRIIDGAHGGAFLNRIKQLMEQFDMNRTF